MGQEAPAPKQYKVAEIDVTGSVSADGRLLSYVDWSTGDLAIRDLRTGEDRRLTNKGSWLESGAFALFSAISPDGKLVAYAWYNEEGSWELRFVGLDGSESRLLYRDAEIPYLEPREWSPDGQHVLAIFRRRDRTHELVLISTRDRSVRVVKALGPRYPREVSFSPDGRYLAYDSRREEDSPSRDIFVLPIEGGRATPLIADPANDLLLGWSPDGKYILFASDRRDTLDAWIIRVRDGRAHGPPMLMKPDIGETFAAGLGFTKAGSYYYGVVSWVNDLYVAALDPQTARGLEPQKLVSNVDFNGNPAWSPDGRYLAYVAHRGRGASPWDDPYTLVLHIRSDDLGTERELPLKLTRFGGHAFELHWSAEGRALLAQARDHDGREGFYRIDATSGAVTPIVQTELCPPDCVEWSAWSPEGKLIFTRWTREGRTIVVRDIAAGEERDLYRVPRPSTIGPLATSRDGRQLAFHELVPGTRSSMLMLIPVAGGEPRELVRVQLPERIAQLAWTPDGRELLFATNGSAARQQKFELWRISPEGGEGGERAPAGLGMQGRLVYGLSVHPDGRRVAVTVGVPRRDEVWVLENLLPGATP